MRSHELDASAPPPMGSVRIQDAYRIDPNELRSLPPGVAYVVTAGRAARVAVARTADEPPHPSPADDNEPAATTPIQRPTGSASTAAPADEPWLA